MKLIKTKNGLYYIIIKNHKKKISEETYLELKERRIKRLTEKYNFSVGDIVNYKDRKGNIIKVKISEINKNVNKGELPDITIQFKNGNVRETVINRISKLK